MSLKCGLVGLPNTGKSTLFNALTNSIGAETGNYPFCTIKANQGQVFVPDKRLKQIGSLIQTKKIIPSSFEFTDIAGLVKGASKGEGLGNQFLSNIREVDSLLHLVRVFKDDQISHVYGQVDPLRDIDIINTELLLSDLEVAEKRFKKIHKQARSTGDKKSQEEQAVLKKVLDLLNNNTSLRQGHWSKEEQVYLKVLNFISLKPVLYICNLKEEEFSNRKLILKDIQQHINKQDALMAISCSMEEQMTGLSDPEKIELLKDYSLTEPALHTVINKVYSQLNLQCFFTAGEKEVRSWTLPKDALAPKAASCIHSDFEKGFIRAEVYTCEDLFKYKSEKILKQEGLLKIVGKDYQVQDGDIMHFLFNV